MKLIIESVCEFEEKCSEPRIKYIVFKTNDIKKVRNYLTKTVYAYNHGDYYKFEGWHDIMLPFNWLNEYTITCWKKVDNVIPLNTVQMDLNGNLTIDDVNEYINI